MENDTLSLFDDVEFRGAVDPARMSLAITAEKTGSLSKNQRSFNRLTKRIEDLQETIKAENAKLEVILKAYLAEMPGLRYGQAIDPSQQVMR